MWYIKVKIAIICVLVMLFLSCSGLLRADDTTTTTPPPITPPTIATSADKIDWGEYVNFSRVVGEVQKVQADHNGFTIKITETYPIVTRSSSRSRRPRINVKTKTKTEQFSLTFHDEGLVRWQKATPKLDERGKKTARTAKENLEIKKPLGAPGYVAERTDLATGMIVEVTLMRPKSVSVQKVLPSDLLVKYAVLAGSSDAPVRVR